jgi:hypothetical protein
MLPQSDALALSGMRGAGAKKNAGVTPMCHPCVQVSGGTADAQAPIPWCAPFLSAAARAGAAADNGRWRVLPKSRYVWEPYGCRLRVFKDTDVRVSSPPLPLSHLCLSPPLSLPLPCPSHNYAWEP